MSLCTKRSLCKYEYHKRCGAAEADLGNDGSGSEGADHRDGEHSTRGTAVR